MNSLGPLFASGSFLVVLLLIALGAIVVYVFYLKNLQDLLKEVAESNREVPPSNVWLMFIPFFNIVYSFILYNKIANSLSAEFQSRDLPQEGDYGKGLGLAIAIVGAAGLIPGISDFTGLPSLILLIVYWVKMAKFKQLLRTTERNGFNMSTNPDLLD